MRNHISCALRSVLFFVLIFAPALSVLRAGGREAVALEASAQEENPKIVAASYDELVVRKLKQPGVTVREAAQYANELLAKNGFNHGFDACPIVEANPQPQEVQVTGGAMKAYIFPLTETRGRRINFKFIGQPTWALCGECAFTIPLLRINRREMLVVSEGKQYLVKRPANFHLEEIDLVDRSMRRVLRTWEVPVDSMPAGISQDGTKIYLDLYNVDSQDTLNKLVLEVSASGVSFHARSKASAQPGVDLKNHPTDPNNSYLSFKRFRAGGRTYIIRFNAPCA